MTRLAWIGLGNMGRGMATNLIQKGNLDGPLILHNRTVLRAESLAAELGEAKALVASTVAEAVAAADVIFTCLTNDQAIQETMEQALEIDVVGKTFADCTTVHPDVTAGLASMSATTGAQYASMTVLGCPSVAAGGQLLCILAGPDVAVDTVRPYTVRVMGRSVIEFRGEPAAKADLLKLVANSFILNVNEVVAEGLTLAEKASIQPEKLMDLLSSLFGGPYTIYAERMVNGDYHKKEPQVPIDMALKDARHALKIAADVGTPLPSLQTAERRLQSAKEQCGPSADSSSVYGISRMESGLPFKN